MGRRIDWADETVWILGASSGIGRALAEELARRGATLILSARKSERFRAVVDACAEPAGPGAGPAAGAVTAEPIDLTDPAETRRAAERVAPRAAQPEAPQEGAPPGRLPVTTVIYAAGVSQRAFLLDMSDEVVDRVLNVNFRSAVAVARAVAPTMQEAGTGRLVFLSSLAAYAPTPLRSMYSASKSALGVAAATLRAELAAAGVEVTLVIPGFVRTAISESALRADGAVHGIIDPNQTSGMDPVECARRILRGLERGRGEFTVAMGFKGRLALLMGRVAPGLQRRLLARIPTSAEHRS